MYALGKRSEIGKSLERAAGLRLDLRSASLIGCDLARIHRRTPMDGVRKAEGG